MSAAVVVLGLVIGTTYGLLAVGLVIVHRVSKVINFAHGAIGLLGAAVLGALVVKYRLPYWLAFAIALAVSGLAGAISEAVVVRRLRAAPKIMSLIATLGLAAFFSSLAPTLFDGLEAPLGYPLPSGLPSFTVGPLLLTPAFTAMLLLAPLLVAAFALFLRYSRTGVAMRAAAANPRTARLIGVSAARMSSLAWTMAGVFAGCTAILVMPTRGFDTSGAFGPALLLRALAAAAIGRMTNLPLAFGAGIGIGVIEQQLYYRLEVPGLAEAGLFVLIFVTLLLRRRPGGRQRDELGWSDIAAPRSTLRLPGARRWVPRVGWLAGLALVAVAITASLTMRNTVAAGWASVFGLAIVALGLGMLSGSGGHLSLGQIAIAGVSAYAGLRLVMTTGNYPLAFLGAGLAGSVLALVIGLPALRERGVVYAVLTLAFGFATESYLLHQSWLVPEAVDFDRPVLLGHSFDNGRDYYYWALVLLLISLWLTWKVRAGAYGRTLIALRDNTDAARGLGIAVAPASAALFAVTGFLAGLGGAVWAFANVHVSPESFAFDTSIALVAAAVIGGLAFTGGPLLGAAYLFAIPQFVALDSAGFAATSLGWLLLLLYLPGGLGVAVVRTRDVVLRRLGATPAGAAGRERGTGDLSDDSDGVVVPELGSGDVAAHTSAQAESVAADPAACDEAAATGSVAPARRAGGGDPVLQVRGLARNFGGLQAVAGLDLDVHAGEILGLIGPNGAGKTTLFELISGFLAPDEGRILLGGNDITRIAAHRLVRRGLVRTFQDARMFPTMTVEDVILAAHHRLVPVAFVRDLLAGGADERTRRRLAEPLIEMMGLDDYRAVRIGELSTGTRRIAELACVLAMRPRIVLLDEPSTGIAQRESEALGRLLLSVREELDATMVVIEHDVPLISGLADRLVAMDAGRLVTIGPPAQVLAHPRVIESYLGQNQAAIGRSGRGVASPQTPAAAVTTDSGRLSR